MKTKIPTENIYWKDIWNEKNVEIEERKNVFVYYRSGIPYAVVFWTEQEAVEAQQWLKANSFTRCCFKNCYIRTAVLGKSCGNHSGDTFSVRQ